MNKNRVPCKNGCVMCGLCCVALTIDDEELQKPAYKKCRHLVYVEDKALCEIHGEKQPKTCHDFVPQKRFKFMWFDHRLRYYKQNEYMQHLVWMAQYGLLDHLPIMKAIAEKNYNRIDDVFKYFIKPFFKAPTGSVPARNDWFELWPGLADYILSIPLAGFSETLDDNAQNLLKKAIKCIYAGRGHELKKSFLSGENQ